MNREIERLRMSIQSVCRSSLPLGKIMDYIQEDVDAMKAELQSWRQENKEHARALLEEQRWGSCFTEKKKKQTLAKRGLNETNIFQKQEC